MKTNEITRTAIGCAIKIHKTLGPGLFESAYESCLYHELKKSGINVQKQKNIPLIYDNVHLECGFRADLVLEDKVIIEVKSVKTLNDIHLAQIITYLKLTNSKVGLLINFNVSKLMHGLKRVANDI